MEQYLHPIGLFDSGLGGISVLAEAVRQMPEENFIYFGDTANMPYGDKQPEEVLKLSRQAVDRLMEMDCKAIVVACNTATSVAAKHLRQEKSFPIIGMEPALKPAALLPGGGSILVLATQMTLQLPKFSNLMENYGQNAIPIACPGLMEFVEAGELSGSRVEAYIQKKLEPFLKAGKAIKAVVLGCTHYVFLRQTIQAVVGAEIPLVDGNEGTVRQLMRKMGELGLKQRSTAQKGHVTFLTAAPQEREAVAHMETMLHRIIELEKKA